MVCFVLKDQTKQVIFKRVSIDGTLCLSAMPSVVRNVCVCVQTSMGGFTAHDYVCNTIKENGIICVEKMEAGGGLRKFFQFLKSQNLLWFYACCA